MHSDLIGQLRDCLHKYAIESFASAVCALHMERGSRLDLQIRLWNAERAIAAKDAGPMRTITVREWTLGGRTRVCVEGANGRVRAAAICRATDLNDA